jgi:SAM-dependent methyltransferase
MTASPARSIHVTYIGAPASWPAAVAGHAVVTRTKQGTTPVFEVKANSLQTPSLEIGLPGAETPGAATRTCPACGGARNHILRFRTNGCDILQCESCGLGRTETSEFDPATYYTEDYFSGRHADGYSDYLGAEPVLRREFAHSVDFIRSYRSSGKLLELGAAYGFFLMEAARHFDVAGIELAADAVEHGRRAGLNVVQGMADETTLRQFGHMDVIVLLDVIEHLPDPRETLALCHRQLNPGGIVVITTGDFGSTLARLAGVRWRLMTPPQHLWFFTQESMRRMSQGLGFSMEHADHPWKIVPASLIVFQLRRMLGMRSAGMTSAGRVGIPVNLFDAMRLVLRKAS